MPPVGEAWSLDQIIADAILADGTLSAKLKSRKVYNGIAGADADLPHVVIGTAAEGELPRQLAHYRGDGSVGSTQLQAWTKGPDKREAQELWGDLKRVLDGRKTTLSTGSLLLISTLRLVGVLPGDERAETMRAVMMYGWTTVRAA